MPKDTGLKVTSGPEWRRPREEGVLKQLPSGKVAQLRRLSLLSLIERGTIPDPLSGLISEMIGGKKLTVDLNTFQDFAEILKVICQVAFIAPRIVDEPQADDEISIEDVDFDDRLHVFNWCQQEVRFLQPFRQEQTGDVEAPHDSDDVPVETEPDSGDSGDVGSVLPG